MLQFNTRDLARAWALFLGLCVFFSHPSAGSSPDANMYNELRSRALHTAPADLGLTLNNQTVSVFGIVMDMGHEQETVTLVAFSTGDASVYISLGEGGVIGGVGHSSVRQLVSILMQSANEHLGSFSGTSILDTPTNGQARLFVLTNRGILGAKGSEADLDAGKLEVSPVWQAGQHVLKALQESIQKPTQIGRHACFPDNMRDVIEMGGHATVRVAFRIGIDGHTKDITIAQSSNSGRLDYVAKSCIQKWTWTPAMQDGVPIEVPWMDQIDWDVRKP